MKDTVKDMLKSDFEKFMNHSLRQGKGFGFEEFSDYTTSVLNFYVGSSIFMTTDKEDAAYYLCQLYNRGIQNIMTVADMRELATALAGDPTLNYAVLNPIFA